MKRILRTKGPSSTKGALLALAASPRAIDKATLKLGSFGLAWSWHYGVVTGLGYFSTAGGREVVICWDEGGCSRKQGGLSDQEWEIFSLAFGGSGKIGIMSDMAAPSWKFEYRFLEARK
jgi:hypothetical protein